MFRILSAALALGLAAPALAEDVSVSAPGIAASLHEGPLDLVAYYGPAADGAMEVVATAAPRTGRGAGAMRVVMALADGDAVSFSMPGYPATRYSFARRGETLAIGGATLVELALAD